MSNISKKEYAEMVKKASPPSPLAKDMLRSFVSGGIICVVGQGFRNFYLGAGMDKTMAGTCVCISLILIAATLTALNVFDKIAKYSGAGTLVPITGFANSVVSPAMEYKTEGLVTGVGSKMFVVAGPVIVYGTVSSIIAGFIYWLMTR